MIKLFIDTSDRQKVEVAINKNTLKDGLTQKIKPRQTQIALELIDMLLKKHGLKPQDVDEIEVVEGPGSYTGLRIGLSIANTFSVFTKAKINKKKSGSILDARYE